MIISIFGLSVTFGYNRHILNGLNNFDDVAKWEDQGLKFLAVTEVEYLKFEIGSFF